MNRPIIALAENEAGWGSPEHSIGGSDGVPTVSEREGAGPSGLEPAKQAEGDIGGVPTREPRKGRRGSHSGAKGIPSLASPRSAQGTPAQHWLAVVLSVALVLALSFALPAGAAQVNEDEVREIASLLRCVVCQNLSVADSPSETASQMREIIRERLGKGETREQVQDYFVSKYGEWILLSPPRRGFNWLVWGLPFAGLLAGFLTLAVVVRRWRRARMEESPDMVDPSYRERVRREVQELEP